MAVDSEARGRRLEADIAAHVAVVLTGLAVWCDSPRHSSRRHARPSRAGQQHAKHANRSLFAHAIVDEVREYMMPLPLQIARLALKPIIQRQSPPPRPRLSFWHSGL